MLGQGGMGHVYLAEDLKLKGKKWAVKECLPFEADLDCFLEEAEMLARLQHPQLPQLVDYFMTDEGSCFLVMDYIEGPNLHDLFEEKGRELPVDKVIGIALQLCDLFHYLHTFQPRPIIYRDLKPSNVMLNEHDQVRLIDFGVARHYTQGKQSDTMQIGTVGFAAPEQFLGQQTDARSDLFTLGANLYYLLSGGQYAYITQQPLEQIRKGLPEALTTTVQMLLHEQPQHRCQSAMEVKHRLRGLQSQVKKAGIGSSFGGERQINHSANGTATPDKLIVVGGLFAGVGSTFTVISIARILHAGQIPHAVIEHPAIEPDLYMLLYGDHKAPDNYTFATDSVSEQTTLTPTPWTSGLTTWVPLHPEGFRGSWLPADTFKLLHAVKKPVIIVDVSTGWANPAVQELCHSADEIVVVLDASPGKCNRPSTRAHLEMLESYRKRGKKVRYIANRSSLGRLHKGWTVSLPEPPLCAIPEIPYDEVMRAVWKGECIQDQPQILDLLSDALMPLMREICPIEVLRQRSRTDKPSFLSRFKRLG
ncbi:serine/threonine protein kinase [Paenibacillus sp. SI8]|uniref:serine/threonine protein kinase n=1 Tax=unclassified Paenibacillus TaxID=185978 RepID=UPI00346784B1